jgi:hypothetical protein
VKAVSPASSPHFCCFNPRFQERASQTGHGNLQTDGNSVVPEVLKDVYENRICSEPSRRIGPEVNPQDGIPVVSGRAPAIP